MICDSVRGYQAAPPEMRGNLMDTNVEQDTIRDLSQRKQVCLVRFLLSLSSLTADLAQWYKGRASDRKVADLTPSSGDCFTLRQGDSLTLLLGWTAVGDCTLVWAIELPYGMPLAPWKTLWVWSGLTQQVL